LDYTSLHTTFWVVAIVVSYVCQHDVFRFLTVPYDSLDA
jgi:hypothetical protein